MPYIPIETRAPVDEILSLLFRVLSRGNLGGLNYIITRLVDWHAASRADYFAYNEILGVLEAVKLEFYRRRVAPYEDKKKKENGDVYGQN